MHSVRTARVATATELIGKDVRDRQGATLGVLEDFAIDLEPVRLGYALLSFDGFLHGGERLFALPPRTLRFDPREAVFRVQVARNVLKNAPGFPRGDRPDLGDRAFGARIHNYYGFTPYWE